ncbi:MAG: autoinducer binding domain-containing protein, partial [Alphaproteobacteria bacterium]|nr:autoinducer binding domain-containing protein [Alphaproteobacteria bacterium]
MTHAISSYGYERIICYSDIGPNALNFRANTDFYNHYNQRNLKIADPVLHLFFTQNNPFTHKQIQLEFLAPEQQAIMKLYQQSGITNSYSIPVGKISKQWVGVTLSSAETSLIEDGYAQQQLFALVNHFIIRYGYISKHWP